MARSPIQQMVDRACGLPDGWEAKPRDVVRLHCVGCGKTKEADRDETDPPGTAVVQVLCPECARGDFSLIEYFDKDGKQILPSEPQSHEST